MWACPQCGREFARANQWHSCGAFPLDDHLARMTPDVRALWDGFVELLDRVGPCFVSPSKSQITFKAPTAFASVKAHRARLDVGFMLSHRLDHPRVNRVESLSAHSHAHRVPVSRPEELDDELLSWLEEAYSRSSSATTSSRSSS